MHSWNLEQSSSKDLFFRLTLGFFQKKKYEKFDKLKRLLSPYDFFNLSISSTNLSRNWLRLLTLMWLTTFIFVEKIGRFVVTELVKLSDEFDIVRTNLVKRKNDVQKRPLITCSRDNLLPDLYPNFSNQVLQKFLH